MEKITNSITIKVYLMAKKPNRLGLYDSESSTLKVSTIFNPENNSFQFKLRIPTHIFDMVKDKDDKYFTNPEKEYSWSTSKKFTQTISDITLSSLIEQLKEISSDATMYSNRNTEKDEKYIAIDFSNSNRQMKDNFNFADMGHLVKSSFQFFVVYKIIKSPHSLDRYNYKSKKRISGGNMSFGDSNQEKRGWYYYGVDIVEQYQLIKWTQEREDFLTKVQNKLHSVNQTLETYLSNLDEDKIELLMKDDNKLLLS